MHKKTVLLVIDQIGTGGAEKILAEFREYLKSNDYNVEVFALYGSDTSIYNYGLKVRNHIHFITVLIDQIVIFFKLMLFIQRVKPLGIFSFLERSNIVVQAIPFQGVKVLSVHNLLSIQYKKISNVFLRESIYSIIRFYYNLNRKTRIVSVSNQVRDDLVRNIGVKESRITVINNSVDKKLIDRLKEEQICELKNVDVPFILNIGRCSVQKAQWKLIKAFYFLINTYKIDNLNLIILGDGPLKNDLLNLIRKLNLFDRVEILPFNTNPYKFINKSVLFALPSLYEGFPIVISEVVAMSKMYIGSKTAIPQEIFDDKNIWAQITCDITSESIELDLNISDEEKSLAELLFSTYSNCILHEKVITSSDTWNANNNKHYQFSSYLELLNI